MVLLQIRMWTDLDATFADRSIRQDSPVPRAPLSTNITPVYFYV